MKLRPLVIVGSAAVIGMLILSAWAWPQIPDDAQVPIHWGIDGTPDGYGPKWLGLLGIPILTALVVALLLVIPRFEPRRANLERSATAYVAVGIAITLFVTALHVAAVLAALGEDINLGMVASIGIGLAFVVMGNYLGKTRSNWFFGIRTPWTLSSDRSWTRTHRLGGIAFVVVGLLVIVTALVAGPSVAIWVLLGGMAASIVGLLPYSYLVWRSDPDRQSVGSAS
ncbi:MAG TPA: SdpI family protein [Candidatus Limnocylindria bacterium]|nr:SdpI family protein [Candidatus Limnocylindria bacterium]